MVTKLMLITQILIAVSLIVINKRLDKMPELMAWECNKVAELEKQWAKRWRDKYEIALEEIYKLRQELLAAANVECCESEKKSGNENKEIQI